MKEKGMLWCFLIVMLFANTLLVGTGMGENPARVYVVPSEIEGVNPCCDPFNIEICVENVEDLYAYELTLLYSPYRSVLMPVEVAEGPFMKQGGETLFFYDDRPFEGLLSVVCILGPPANQGVSGSGILATIKFRVLEAGESDLKFIRTDLINSQYESIPHDTDHSYHKGPRVELVNLWGYKNELKVSEKQTCNATVKKRSESCIHEPDEPPLWTLIKLEVESEDGDYFVLYTDTYHIEQGRDYTFPPIEWYPEAGTYYCTARAWFSYENVWFNPSRVRGFSFVVHEN